MGDTFVSLEHVRFRAGDIEVVPEHSSEYGSLNFPHRLIIMVRDCHVRISPGSVLTATDQEGREACYTVEHVVGRSGMYRLDLSRQRDA